MKKALKFLTILFVTLLLVAIGYLMYLRYCPWNPQEAAKYATENAQRRSVGLCAMYIRKAMIAGGIPLHHLRGDAWHYKYILPILGFQETGNRETPEVGDIVVFQPIGNRKYGHIAIWNGKQWVSDFRQRGFIVHSDYKKEGCEYAIFRRR